MKPLLAVLVISWSHYSHAKLLITGHPIPSLYLGPIKVECLLQDSNYTMDDVQIEEYTGSGLWVKARVRRRACFVPNVKPVRTENTLSLTHEYLLHNISYRCVLKGPNMTTPEYTEPLNFTANFLYNPQVSSRSPRYNGALVAEAGNDVELKCKALSSVTPKFFWFKEGDDWILPSDLLTLNNVSATDKGRYTCIVEHTIAPMSKNVTITLKVLPGGLQRKIDSAGTHRLTPRNQKPWTKFDGSLQRQVDSAGEQSRSRTTPGNQKPWTKFDDTLQMTIITAICTAFFVVNLFLTVYYCFYVKKIKITTNKGPIDDHSAKKPIYKSCIEPVPITCDDKRPLV
ncbi:uncharacterized protein [Eucyclogobius newberryi]|uniref:uncharacterized protein isoform X2 n=1 Tax=Eucyclogobius newberryi TaxID=166745 RepID=UPI003B5980EC